MRFILAILLLPNLAFALNGSFEASNNITGQADAIYLKLDASNDPLTGTLSGTNLIMSGTATIQGNAFSVGGSTLVVKSGNVGIGTTGPEAKLVVSSGNVIVDGNDAVAFISKSSSSALTPLKMVNGYIGATNRISLHNAANTIFAYEDFIIDSATDGHISWGTRTSGTPSYKMTLTSGGNVGIGTPSPVTRLDVFGNINGVCQTVQLINADNVAHSSGTLVRVYRKAGYTVHITTAGASAKDTIGTIQDVSCAAGGYCSVGISGNCKVLLDSAETCPDTTHVLVSGEIGRADCVDIATIPDHFLEIGHPLITDASAGSVIDAILHFN